MILLQPWKWQKGEEAEKLRLALAEHFQADVTLFASGREALLALLQSMNVGKGDEVILPDLTIISCAFAILYTGATPIVVDVDPKLGNIDPAKIETKITKRTKAIMTVHLYGHPA
ncbi:DegT/DnrJ/EryC1/StrS family aminotransferase, partial [Candidatus Peregrinibacteria bacterium]|nr:DegT/DnrJ/EryC1/StrS family aminotransferase [Candidatus Peregrinibacteria bacterium]